MADALKAAFAVGILLFGAALFVPPLADATQDDATETLEVNNGTDTAVTERLTAAVTDVDTAASPSHATIAYTNNRTLNTTATTVDVGNTSTVMLSGDGINTTVTSISGETVQFDVEYPPMFGWDREARLFFENSELILVLLGAVVIVGAVAVVLK